MEGNARVEVVCSHKISAVYDQYSLITEVRCIFTCSRSQGTVAWSGHGPRREDTLRWTTEERGSGTERAGDILVNAHTE